MSLYILGVIITFSICCVLGPEFEKDEPSPFRKWFNILVISLVMAISWPVILGSAIGYYLKCSDEEEEHHE